MASPTAGDGASRAAGVFAGAGIGLLVGVLLGLSVSEVVGAVVGAIAALLAAVLGLSDKSPLARGEDAATPPGAARDARIGSFGIACTLGVLLGLFVRTHDLLGVPLDERVAAWEEAGLSHEAARDVVTYQETGLVPEGRAVAAPGDDARRRARASVLYAADAEACADLAPERYADDAELLNAWRLQGGAWRALADALPDARPDRPNGRRRLAQTAWRLACDPGA